MIRIALVGCGYWGPLHIRAFRETAGACVTMAADLDPARLAHIARLYPDLGITRDLDDVLDGPIDAVVVATPAGTHADVAARALMADKHVLIEKPMATDSDACAALIDLARARGRCLMVGHTFLYHTAVRTLHALVQSGELGDLYYIDSTRVNLGLHRKDVDVIWDLATHDVAILRYLLGDDPTTVTATGAAFHDPDKAEVAYIQCGYPSGALANLHVSWLDPVKIRRMTIVGSRRMAVWDDVEPRDKLKLYDRGVDHRPYYSDFGQWQIAYRHGEPHTVPIDFVEPLRLQAEEFVAAIREGRAPLTSGTDGLSVVRTLEQVTDALELQRGLALSAGLRLAGSVRRAGA